MKKKSVIIIIAILVIAISLIVFSYRTILFTSTTVCTQEAKICPDGSAVGRIGANCQFATCPVVPNGNVALGANNLSWPLTDALSRITKKPFGIKISPKDSPVQPEKFSGYHTGVDFETLPSEQNIDVPVKAICSGTLLMKKSATGYGGVAVEKCEIDKQGVTVIYGHLRLSSVTAIVGSEIKVGDQLGVLGTGFSKETDGERKHLHLGIHKGASINILGYVQTEAALADWLDATKYLK